jgi:hypothetical protein
VEPVSFATNLVNIDKTRWSQRFSIYDSRLVQESSCGGRLRHQRDANWTDGLEKIGEWDGGGSVLECICAMVDASFTHAFAIIQVTDLTFEIFISPKQKDDFSTTALLDPLLATLQQIDVIHNLISLYPSSFKLATSAEEIWVAFRRGRIASLIGVEGLHQIGNSVSVLRMFHRLGVRYITLTHDENNMWAESSVSLRLCSKQR